MSSFGYLKRSSKLSKPLRSSRSFREDFHEASDDDQYYEKYPPSISDVSQRDFGYRGRFGTRSLQSQAQTQAQMKRYGGEFVQQLTPDDFDEFIRKHPKNLVAFHSPTCGHCIRLGPKFEETAKILRSKKSPVKLAAIDAQEYSDFSQQEGVQGFPTLRAYRKRDKFREYEGDRTPDDMMRFAEMYDDRDEDYDQDSNSMRKESHGIQRSKSKSRSFSSQFDFR